MKIIYTGFLLLLTAWGQAREYTVSVRGISAGKANLSIQQTGGAYQAQLTLYPNMVAKMFDINDMREVAVGKIIEGKLVPSSYKREELSGKVLLSVEFFDKQVKVDEQGEKRNFRIEKFAQDPLSQIIQIQHDLKAGKVAWGYYTVTDKAQYYSDARQKGRQINLTQTNKSGDMVSLWFDEGYELTRMLKRSEGKVVFDMKQR